MATNAVADRFDHIVLTVHDIEETTKFYQRALGFEREIFRGSDGQPRYALRFGEQKINLQDRASDTANKAQAPTFGSADFCLIAAVPLQQVVAHLRTENIAIVGPVVRRAPSDLCDPSISATRTGTLWRYRNTAAVEDAWSCTRLHCFCVSATPVESA